MQPPDRHFLERRARPENGGRRKYDKPKAVIQSRTIICAAVGMAASLYGYAVSCEEQRALGEHVSTVITFIAAFGAFVFRLLATRRIG